MAVCLCGRTQRSAPTQRIINISSCRGRLPYLPALHIHITIKRQVQRSWIAQPDLGPFTNSAQGRAATPSRTINHLRPRHKKTTHALHRRFAFTSTVSAADVVRLPNRGDFRIRDGIAVGPCGARYANIGKECSAVTFTTYPFRESKA